MAGQSSIEQWLTWSVSPSISAILVTLLVSLLLPVLIHTYLYRKAVAKETPSFLLVGPSGAGKTSLLTLVCQNCYMVYLQTDKTSVRKRNYHHNPHEPRTSNRPLRTPILNTLLGRSIQIRERHIGSRTAKVSTRRYTRSRQATAPCDLLPHTRNLAQRPAICRG